MDENLNQAIESERREYFRSWRANSHDKVRQHNKAYWRKRAERKLQEQQTAKQAERVPE
ncbi:MAG: hypothetical protein FWE32_04900 [Oscillospiraceae bacterium]|nr:hypothetical protein [Oscillospiraceae bacterium]